MIWGVRVLIILADSSGRLRFVARCHGYAILEVCRTSDTADLWRPRRLFVGVYRRLFVLELDQTFRHKLVLGRGRRRARAVRAREVEDELIDFSSIAVSISLLSVVAVLHILKRFAGVQFPVHRYE
ncbi:hypothetical protein TSAR_016690 [Trichomalopsis sarcophagae]|uniref:Uncharacterized protein n=1 Tax=Trichomalopsis sarcophagae TaxID=543379 RepID=A0A232F4G2_9HYME|nr:hypothetical protein TSAR_016690 [Trichomalopsis sarcophagae]